MLASGCVAEELLEAAMEVHPGRRGHGRSDGANCNEHGVIDCARKEEEGAYDLLAKLFLRWRQFGIFINRFGILDIFSVSGSVPLVR